MSAQTKTHLRSYDISGSLLHSAPDNPGIIFTIGYFVWSPDCRPAASTRAGRNHDRGPRRKGRSTWVRGMTENSDDTVLQWGATRRLGQVMAEKRTVGELHEGRPKKRVG